MKRTVTAALLALALLAEPANAHVRARGDSDDSPSRLDLAGIALGHLRKDVFMLLSLRRRWRISWLRPRGNYVVFEFDSRGGPGSDYYLFADY